MLVPAFECLCLYLDFRSVWFLLFLSHWIKKRGIKFHTGTGAASRLHSESSSIDSESWAYLYELPGRHYLPAIIHDLKISSSTYDNWIEVGISFSPITVKQIRRSNRNALAILLSSMNWTMRFHHSTFEWFVVTLWALFNADNNCLRFVIGTRAIKVALYDFWVALETAELITQMGLIRRDAITRSLSTQACNSQFDSPEIAFSANIIDFETKEKKFL